MFELLLKASLAIGVAFLFYKLVLQQESFFATNRFYLLGCLALAFVMPFITLPKMIDQQGILSEVFEQKVSLPETASEKADFESSPIPAYEIASEEISALEATQKNNVVPTETVGASEVILPAPQTSGTTAETTEFSFMFWISALYLFGIGIFSLSLLFQLGSIALQIMRATDKIKDGDYVIVNTAERKAPCSFFKYIFIHPNDYDFETYEQIIAHEKTHVRLGHSFDLLFAELAVITLWFNPFVWFLKKEIEKNNEYQTDSMLLEKEQVRKDQYQLNLLQIAVPNKPLNITTNYNQSLIKKRILMMNSKRSTPHAYWKYAFLLPLFFGILLLINEPATGQEQKKKTSAEAEKETTVSEEKTSENFLERSNNAARERENLIERTANAVVQREELQERVETAVVQRENLQERVAERRQLVERRNVALVERELQTDMTKGAWYSSIKNGKYCIEFRGASENSRWNMSDCFDRSAFQKKSDDTFVMSNEVGTLKLIGNLNAEVGQGKYSFTENSSFRNFLNQNQIADVSNNNMFHLFFGDFTKDYISYIKSQYPNVNGDDLTALAIHGVKQDQFRNFVSLFENHSGGKASIDDVVGLKIHGVTESYVEELHKMGFSDLGMDEIMSAKIHGVSAEYSRSLKNAGFSNLSIDEIVSAKIHGVSPETIKEMKALGAKDLDKIVELQIHNVSADYVRELQEAGLGDLSLDEIISAKIHGLSASSIKEIKAMGFKNLDFNDLLTAEIHNVNPAFVKDLEKAGFANLDMNKVVSARIHGINSEFIQNARKNGYELNSIDKYISLKIHGSAIQSLKNN